MMVLVARLSLVSASLLRVLVCVFRNSPPSLELFRREMLHYTLEFRPGKPRSVNSTPDLSTGCGTYIHTHMCVDVSLCVCACVHTCLQHTWFSM